MEFKKPYTLASSVLPYNEPEVSRKIFEFVETTYKQNNTVTLHAVVQGTLNVSPLDGSEAYLKIGLKVEDYVWKTLFGVALKDMMLEDGSTFIPQLSNVQKERYFPWAIDENIPLIVIKGKKLQFYEDLVKFLETGSNPHPMISVQFQPKTFHMQMKHPRGIEACGISLVLTSKVTLL